MTRQDLVPKGNEQILPAHALDVAFPVGLAPPAPAWKAR